MIPRTGHPGESRRFRRSRRAFLRRATLVTLAAAAGALGGACKRSFFGAKSAEGDPAEGTDPAHSAGLGGDRRGDGTGDTRRASASLEEVRGVWVTTVDSQALFSAAGVTAAFERLNRLNFTTVYPAVWNGRNMPYPSNVVQRAAGAMPVRAEFTGRDVVRELLDAGHATGLRVTPWFEYGLRVPTATPLFAAKRDWFTTDAQGNARKTSGGIGMAWLNPLLPEVQAFLADLCLEFLERYDVRAIQWDDNLAVPKALLYDRFTRALWRAEDGREPPTSESDARYVAWTRWRAARISEAVRRIFAKVRAARPSLVLSISPNPYPWSLNNYLQDWPAWVRQGSFDNVVVQLYRDSVSALAADLASPSLQEFKARTAVGILSGLRGKPASTGVVTGQVEAARAAGYRGVSFFFYESLLGVHAGADAAMREATLAGLFNVLSREPTGF